MEFRRREALRMSRIFLLENIVFDVLVDHIIDQDIFTDGMLDYIRVCDMLIFLLSIPLSTLLHIPVIVLLHHKLSWFFFVFFIVISPAVSVSLSVCCWLSVSLSAPSFHLSLFFPLSVCVSLTLPVFSRTDAAAISFAGDDIEAINTETVTDIRIQSNIMLTYMM